MDKMREEFEAWFKTEKESLVDVKYQFLTKEIMFEGWQASRAALCVEIPKTGEASSFGKYVVFDTEAVKEMLDVAGVSYK